MPYAGKTIMGREQTDYAYHAGWTNLKVEATATFMGEGGLSVGAYHDNYVSHSDIKLFHTIDPVESRRLSVKAYKSISSEATPASRDTGLGQYNILWRYVGTEYEWKLRSESKVFEEYDPVAKFNMEQCRQLFMTPWVGRTFREFGPWYAYTSGWCLFRYFYVYHRDPITGQSIGPWVATGRYLMRAIQAVANWHHYIAKTLSLPEALAEAIRLADVYKVDPGGVLTYNDTRGVYWRYPKMPTEPPADGRGPYPVKNNGESYLLSMIREEKLRVGTTA